MNHRIPCAAGLAAIVLAGAPAFAAENKDVRVVNTPAEAIPVSATGTVALAPGTQVGVAGPVALTPDTQVSLTPETQVGVANTAANPLHVVASAAQPDVFVRSEEIPLEADQTIGFGFITVPSDKRLVIEQVGGKMIEQVDKTVDYAIRVLSSGGGTEFHYPAEGRATAGFPIHRRYIFSEPLRAYHDGNHGLLRVGVIRSEGSLMAVAEVTVSGYLVDLP